jgi:SAM-dependent methyltransferase
MTPDEVTALFRDEATNFAPWRTRHVIGGTAYGGEIDYAQDDRWSDCLAMWRPVGRILEFGCFEGGHTALLAAQPAVTAVHAVDGRDYLVERTGRAAKPLGLNQVTVARCNADEPAEVEALGRFDGVFFSGLLYHAGAVEFRSFGLADR